jgi:hypothetical protein
MKRNRRAAAIRMPELLMRTALPNFDKPELHQRHDLA